MIIIRIIPIILIYIIIITKTKGRFSRYEYLIKGLIAYCLIIISTILIILSIPVISFFMMIFIIIAIYSYVKYTIKRLYDLGMSGYYLLLTIIPIIGLILTIILFTKKSNIEPNEYDEAIKYQNFCKGKHIINIFRDRLMFDDIEFRIDYYLKKMIIKIIDDSDNNIFSDYLFKNYQSRKENFYYIVEIVSTDFLEILKKLELIVLYESKYIKIMDYKLFIRYYNFRYDIIINKEDHQLTKEIIDTFNFPGAYFEDEKYIYYNGLTKEELIEWIKNVA